MRSLLYIGRRLIFVIPQLVCIVLVSFFLLKMIPGDPAALMLGPMAKEDSILEMRKKYGLDKPLPIQLGIYLKNMAKGDLGTSWQTTNPVVEDLFERFPATLELITYGMLLSIGFGVPLGVFTAYRKRGTANKIGNVYGLLAGSIPDFWLALVLIFIFYTLLAWVSSPMGRIDIIIAPPTKITGFYTIDSLFTRNWEALYSSFAHLILPAVTLGFIFAAPILKITQASMQRMLDSDFSRYERLCGLTTPLIRRRALRNALPSIVTVVSFIYGFLLGGAVLVEIVFSWGGAGQYAINSVLASDINPVLGFVTVSAVMCVIIYLIVDLIYLAIDPRISR